MDDSLALAFGDASHFFVDVVALVPSDRWDSPGLGSWAVRELVAHANRSHTLLADYLLRPQPPEPPASAYFAPEAVAARGRQAVTALGDDPAAAVKKASADAISLVATTPADATIGSPAGTMTLASYLPSRIAELTIHGIDVARVIGADMAPPPLAIRESLGFVIERVAATASQEVLLALTGRGSLPVDFSVY